MTRMKYFYNDELEINDLIRDAHPYGGTEVVAVDSGEGHVEDIIENQMKTLDMVFKQPAIEALANLGNELDKEGLYSLASSVDDLLNPFEKMASPAAPILLGGGIAALLGGGGASWQLWKGIQKDFLTDVRDLKDNVAGWYKDKDYAGQAANNLYAIVLTLEKLGVQLDKEIAKGIYNPQDQDVFEKTIKLGDKIHELVGKTDQFVQYFSKKFHGYTGLDFSRTRGLVEDIKTSWGELVNSVEALSAGQSIEIVQEENDLSKTRETDSTPATKQKTPAKRNRGSGSSLLLRIQQAVNQILGKKVLSETKKDPALWSVIKGKPFLGQKNTMLNKSGKRQTYKNYNEMYAILSTYLKGESAKSKVKDKSETTHVNFVMDGVNVQHFPITRALHFVDKRNPQAMAKATNLFIAWLQQTTDLPVPTLNYSDYNSVSQMVRFLHKVSLAINQGQPTDGTNITRDEKYGTAFPRIISYIGELSQFLLVFAEKLRSAKELKEKQLANAKNIFEFLAAQWTHAKPAHPFFFLLKNQQAKKDLLNYMVDLGIADKQERMIAAEGRVIGLMPKIETQVKNLVRNYGIR